MGLLDWFRQSTPSLGDERLSPDLINNTIAYLVKMTDSRLTLVPRYHERLSGPVRICLEFLMARRGDMPAVHDATALAWSLDPSLHAFFGAADSMQEVFGSCDSLRNYAAQSSPLDPIYAVLAMEYEENRHFGVGMQGQMVVRDVAQTALSFRQPRLRLFARTEQDLWRSVARRLLDELAVTALEHMEGEQAQRRELAEQRQLISARLATFRQRGAGADSFLGGDGLLVSNDDSHALLQKLEENEAELAALGGSEDLLERQLGYLVEVLTEPAKHLQIERRTVRLDSMNVVCEGHSGEEVEFGVVSFTRQLPQRRAFLPLRVDRSLIGEGRKLKLDSAERWL
ncbi:hypothetical protein [Uliginosibacterium sp. 31-12]|uniref:hypothetical protein n=1 Tax=Uliginosibacterium sp. 31-12 TaxID=3062781 RepID=UPI0026E1AB55|nr:hypothetical protein [Uliginosibacterium sp. 31-12]MDO6386272.1 hypothetical protein [Uliginosibacterium sp. 31-12]